MSEFEASGVEIREGDIAKNSIKELTDLLNGADVVTSTVLTTFTDQTTLIYAAKAANVKRFVPSEFGYELPRGVIWIQDNVRNKSLILLNTASDKLQL